MSSQEGKEFALRTAEGEYYSRSADGEWKVISEEAGTHRFTDSREALQALEELRGAGQTVDLYTSDEHGHFSVAVA